MTTVAGPASSRAGVWACNNWVKLRQVNSKTDKSLGVFIRRCGLYISEPVDSRSRRDANVKSARVLRKRSSGRCISTSDRVAGSERAVQASNTFKPLGHSPAGQDDHRAATWC